MSIYEILVTFECMKMRLFFILLWFFQGKLFSQGYLLENKTRLSDTLSESSGLIQIDGKFFTHGDSGDEPIVYEIDTLTGCINSMYKVPGATNIDWEEITRDDSFVYIGDFGNNTGNRKNLVVYKLRIQDLLNRDKAALVGKIGFSYANQTDFSNKTYQTNFDAEAMIAADSGLYFFTKNWGNFKTYVYRCPKEIGNYSIQLIDSFNIGGLTTGASYLKGADQLILCGYTFNAPFVLVCDSFFRKGFFKKFVKQEFDQLGNIQIEAVAHLNFRVFLTSEKLNQNASLFELKVRENVNNHTFLHPGTIQFSIDYNDNRLKWDAKYKIYEANVLNLNGQKLVAEKSVNSWFNNLNIMDLKDGVYVFSGIDIFGNTAQFKFVLNR